MCIHIKYVLLHLNFLDFTHERQVIPDEDLNQKHGSLVWINNVGQKQTPTV